jgi:hypothetical protein
VRDLPRGRGHVIAFMRMAAEELRKMADREPQLSAELRRMADELDAEADDLVGDRRK